MTYVLKKSGVTFAMLSDHSDAGKITSAVIRYENKKWCFLVEVCGTSLCCEWATRARLALLINALARCGQAHHSVKVRARHMLTSL